MRPPSTTRTTTRPTTERTSAIDCIRNVGIIAHVDAGKTTLTERILRLAGRIHIEGEVHDGNTVTDYLPEERKRGITITAAAVTCRWRERTIQIVDTPGHADFAIEVERSLRVLDGAIVVLDAVAGVEPQTEAVWRSADRHRVPRIVLINKLDRAGATMLRSVCDLRERLGARAVPIVVPIGNEDRLRGLVDVIERRARMWPVAGHARFEELDVPSELVDDVEAARAAIVDACADDDAVVAELVETGHVGCATLAAALRRATLAGRVVPVLAGSAYRRIGVEGVLDAVVDLLPSPIDRGCVRAEIGGERRPDPEAPLAALCFKAVHDGFGQRTFVRVYSGTLRRGQSVRAMRLGDELRVARLVRLFADSTEDVDEAGPGAIAAILGPTLATGETLCDPDHPIELEPIMVPEPVMSVALTARARRDEERLPVALARSLAADPSLRTSTHPETGELLLAGMGVLHLEVTVSRLATEHGVEVVASPPRVACRETVARAVVHEHRHIKQSGGPGQFAIVRIELSPGPPGSGARFESRVRAGAIPVEHVPAVRAGVLRAAACGPLGFPLVDFAVTLLDGAFHPNDSSDLAFSIAGHRALLEAARLAGPVLLEPWSRLEVRTPKTALGEVLGDLGTRRARVLDLANDTGDTAVVVARAPLSELFRYEAALRSHTRGRGSAASSADGYERVPAALVEAVTART